MPSSSDASPLSPAQGNLRARDRLARRPAPFIWQEAARRMADRLVLLRAQPGLILDVGCAWGDGISMLRQQYAQARILGLEPSSLLANVARKEHGGRGWLRGLLGRGRVEVVCAPLVFARTIANLPEGQAGASMLWSNLALPWATDVQGVFGAWQRVLQPDGVLMFTTFGPDTLRELRLPELRALGIQPPSYPDMHDLGDMLVHEGFAEPVMDMELVHLRYPNPRAALIELAELGRPAHAKAALGLRTPRQWQILQDILLKHAKLDDSGEVEFSFELVYGHAFKPATQLARDGVATFPLEQLRASGKKR